MPRSPWLASAGCRKNAGVPVLASVAAILPPTWPDLPIPETTTRPVQASSMRQAFSNSPPRRSTRAATARASIRSASRPISISRWLSAASFIVCARLPGAVRHHTPALPQPLECRHVAGGDHPAHRGRAPGRDGPRRLRGRRALRGARGRPAVRGPAAVRSGTSSSTARSAARWAAPSMRCRSTRRRPRNGRGARAEPRAGMDKFQIQRRPPPRGRSARLGREERGAADPRGGPARRCAGHGPATSRTCTT